MFNLDGINTLAPYQGYEIHDPRRTGWDAGLRDGFDEGYVRGRAQVIMSTPKSPPAISPIKVLYVGSGKGFPYSPIDEAVIATLRNMVAEVTVSQVGESLSELAAAFSPDLMLVLDGMEVALEQIDAVRALGVRTAVWLTDDPYYTDVTIKMVPHFDYVFTLERNCIDLYLAAGASNVYYLPFAAHPEHFSPTLQRSAIRRDLSFIGSAYWNRINFLQPILGDLMHKGLHINGIWWDRLPEFNAYPNQIEIGKWMGPRETAEVYSGTKIMLNLHRSPHDESVNQNSSGITAVSPNPRTFEISACATLQIVDAREDMASFYIPGVEIETFTSSEELLSKVDYYLTHERERSEIALRGLERTFRDHTYENRIQQLLQHIFG